jgi:hypothetical protein
MNNNWLNNNLKITAFAGILLGQLTLADANAQTIPGVTTVPGKEYSNNLDHTYDQLSSPGQTVNWDGAGGTSDGLNFSSTGGFPRVEEGTFIQQQVDALGNGGDYLYDEVTTNFAPLLFSVSPGTHSPALEAAHIYYENTDGSGGVWATPGQINSTPVGTTGAPAPLSDVDGLEIWGGTDTSHYSLTGDAINGLTSVYSTTGGSSATTYIDQPTINSALQGLLNMGGGHIPDLHGLHIDVDAMMLSDQFGTQETFDHGDRILFSVAPLEDSLMATIFDGGEIFELIGGSSSATYLSHGGHLWDTAFDVAGTFGLMSENINALEAASVAIPEPSTYILLGMTMCCVAYQRNKKISITAC